MDIRAVLRRWRAERRTTRAARAFYGRSPSPESAEAHDLRVELALARSRALRALHWTPDVVPRAQLAACFDSLSVRDPGIPLIRVGGDRDGGYLVPDDLEGIVACFSPGVDDRASFEAALVERGIPCHLLDASVTGPPFEHPLLSFSPLFLGGVARPGWTTLASWVGQVGPATGDLVLQMDIEGWEWEVLAGTDDATLNRFRILVIELHDLHLLATTCGMRRCEEAFARLQKSFALVHVHPNNYEFPVDYLGFRLHPVVETTWIRRDRMRQDQPASALGHPLEQANATDLPDFLLDPRWA